MVGDRIFWRKVGTHKFERFRPGFKKPKTYFRQSPLHGRKFPIGRPTYESAKKGWKGARRFGGTRFHPFNILPTPKRPAGGWGRYKKKSKGKSSIATASGRTATRRKTMRAPSTPKDKPKFVRYRKGGCPPGYVYDPKRKMCIQRRYR